ncbi:methyltransferase family protein [Undibacterium terreum]|uniref:Protein-S-isoprenylcysteine O-methyltransferase n=1 Tax=Undibacterium terreum TaxID=1224302 RepID=A0A916U263_9BURK|nr:hypothetical protein [Undibacterium terreum]GGC57707.1 hypothetical protein GCM10011396_00700 [Undibacterium terreum]
MIALPITGTDSRVRQLVANYCSTVLLMYLGLLFYTEFSVYHAGIYGAYWEPQTLTWMSAIHISTPKALRALFWAYAVVLVPYFALAGNVEAKGYLFIKWLSAAVSGRTKMLPAEKQAALVLLLKFVFVPFIINAGIVHVCQLNYRIVDVFKYYSLPELERPYFVKDMAVLYLQIATAFVYTLDVVPFVVGYLTESHLQDNKIKSVDVTASGWFFCLMCYPPFNNAAGAFIPTNVPDHVESFAAILGTDFIGRNLHLVLNSLAVLFLLAYASCSVSLGWKCSNLTSRGVVRSGLYGIVRHPAYVCKNAAWWIFAGSIAIHNAAAGRPWVFDLLCLALFTCVYAMRAITEERHLQYSDVEYASYCQQVPYRFLPCWI